jgi:hypothetical protein
MKASAAPAAAEGFHVPALLRRGHDETDGTRRLFRHSCFLDLILRQSTVRHRRATLRDARCQAQGVQRALGCARGATPVAGGGLRAGGARLGWRAGEAAGEAVAPLLAGGPAVRARQAARRDGVWRVAAGGCRTAQVDGARARCAQAGSGSRDGGARAPARARGARGGRKALEALLWRRAGRWTGLGGSSSTPCRRAMPAAPSRRVTSVQSNAAAPAAALRAVARAGLPPGRARLWG